jgi:hypothetical protein
VCIPNDILDVIIVQWELELVFTSDGIARLLHKRCPNVMVEESVEKRRIILCRVGDYPLEVTSPQNGCEAPILEHLEVVADRSAVESD